MLILMFWFFYFSYDFAIRKQLLESSMKSYKVTGSNSGAHDGQ